jgi:formate dehydrogenase iron-sulfur subunit
MSKGMLIDTTRCIGCRGCQVACKAWNGLDAVKSGFSETGTYPLHLDASTFTRVLFRDVVQADGKVKAVYVKRQCMHCNEPACASACPVGALQKTKDGPVVYADSKCIGCRYCMLACPFNVPKFQWNAVAPYIRKCTFCADRQAAGLAPSCVTTCPAEAITFGERSGLVQEAHRRIDASPKKYAPTVYGEQTAGGTSVLYLTPFPIEALGLEQDGFRTDLGNVAQGRATQEWMSNVPTLSLAVGGLALGLYHLNQRRAEVEKQEGKEG